MSFADKVIRFNEQLRFDGPLPYGIGILDPFKDPYIRQLSAAFYKKYYDDDHQRHLILGINPGRFGAGLTGIPFTDPKRLKSELHMDYNGPETHEPSSVYIYEMINAYGGPERFYHDIYIHSVCPLGFVQMNNKSGEVNYNYYDSKELTAAMYNFILEHLHKQIALGVATDVCFCFGTGKNYKFLDTLNKEHRLFGKIVPLEHPRFIMQYKNKTKQAYIDKYLEEFAKVM